MIIQTISYFIFEHMNVIYFQVMNKQDLMWKFSVLIIQHKWMHINKITFASIQVETWNQWHDGYQLIVMIFMSPFSKPLLDFDFIPKCSIVTYIPMARVVHAFLYEVISPSRSLWSKLPYLTNYNARWIA